MSDQRHDAPVPPEQPVPGPPPPGWGSGYGWGQPGWGGPAPVDPQAQSRATTAMILGIVGLVSGFGVILGPIALVQAGKAAEGGADATAGRILGWVSTILGAVMLLLIVAWLVFVLSMLGSALHSVPDATVSPASLGPAGRTALGLLGR